MDALLSIVGLLLLVGVPGTIVVVFVFVGRKHDLRRARHVVAAGSDGRFTLVASGAGRPFEVFVQLELARSGPGESIDLAEGAANVALGAELVAEGKPMTRVEWRIGERCAPLGYAPPVPVDTITGFPTSTRGVVRLLAGPAAERCVVRGAIATAGSTRLVRAFVYVPG
ncbi:MAG TPA: hypothetical protein VHB21_18680 [Minicystis sp.]|nr:hypothetical protein [Minicystis sp.]